MAFSKGSGVTDTSAACLTGKTAEQKAGERSSTRGWESQKPLKVVLGKLPEGRDPLSSSYTCHRAVNTYSSSLPF